MLAAGLRGDEWVQSTGQQKNSDRNLANHRERGHRRTSKRAILEWMIGVVTSKYRRLGAPEFPRRPAPQDNGEPRRPGSCRIAVVVIWLASGLSPNGRRTWCEGDCWC